MLRDTPDYSCSRSSCSWSSCSWSIILGQNLTEDPLTLMKGVTPTDSPSWKVTPPLTPPRERGPPLLQQYPQNLFRYISTQWSHPSSTWQPLEFRTGWNSCYYGVLSPLITLPYCLFPVGFYLFSCKLLHFPWLFLHFPCRLLSFSCHIFFFPFPLQCDYFVLVFCIFCRVIKNRQGNDKKQTCIILFSLWFFPFPCGGVVIRKCYKVTFLGQVGAIRLL